MTIWGGASNPYAQRRVILAGARLPHGDPLWPAVLALPEVFLPYYAMDLPDRLLVQGDSVRQAYRVLEDGPSREEFVAQLRWRLLLDFDRLPAPVTHPVYFPPDLYCVNDAEVFVDCGAYDGDTVKTLLGLTSFSRGTVFAFEPDPLTFARLEQYHANLPQAAKSRIHISQKAVGERAGTISFAMTGLPASTAGSGDTVVECVPLDDVLKDVHPTIIKMDIEGSEIAALNGAADTIRTHRPILAISAYHTQNHFWEIPQLIKDLSSDYHIFLRPHLIEVWELAATHTIASSAVRMKARPCPICHTHADEVLYRQRFSPLSTGTLLEGYDVVTCPACGLGFADKIPDQAAFDAHYEEMSKYEYQHLEGRESEYDQARFGAMVEFMVPYLSDQRCRILDVGCATGGLLDQLQSRGFGDVTGLDPSPPARGRRCAYTDLTVFTGTLASSPLIGSTFGLVILVGVLEHLRDLEEAFARVRGMLEPEGLIYVEVPDAVAFPRWDGPPFQEFSTEHVNFFSRQSLDNLLRANGFEAVRAEVTARPIAPGLHAPVVFGMYRMCGARRLPERDSETRARARDLSATRQNRGGRASAVGSRPAAFVTLSGVIVWGAGTLSQHLLAAGVLPADRIVAFIDNNPHYEGRTLAGANEYWGRQR